MEVSTITAFGGMIVLVIGSIGSAVVLIIKQAQTKAAIVEIKPKLERIELLVDGRYGEVLQELADVKLMLADKTGKLDDKLRAEQAQTKADEQTKRVELLPKSEEKR